MRPRLLVLDDDEGRIAGVPASPCPPTTPATAPDVVLTLHIGWKVEEVEQASQSAHRARKCLARPNYPGSALV
jgi:hypothetical protein